VALSLSCIVVSCSSCKGNSSKAAPDAAASAASRPVDELVPGELAEGEQRAFGLPIPRRMRVSATFPDAVFAVGALRAEDVSNYVRERVVAQRVETGPSKTVFTKAKLKAEPERTMRIEVVLKDGATELVVRDETPPPVEPGLSPEERMRKKGLLPDGTPIDKTRLE
jgi:hypothetical protein